MNEAEEKDDYSEALQGVETEYRGVKYFFERLTLWQFVLMVLMALNTISNGVLLYLYYFKARPTAQIVYRSIQSRVHRLDMREKVLEDREKRVQRRVDSLKAADTTKLKDTTNERHNTNPGAKN